MQEIKLRFSFSSKLSITKYLLKTTESDYFDIFIV